MAIHNYIYTCICPQPMRKRPGAKRPMSNDDPVQHYTLSQNAENKRLYTGMRTHKIKSNRLKPGANKNHIMTIIMAALQKCIKYTMNYYTRMNGHVPSLPPIPKNEIKQQEITKLNIKPGIQNIRKNGGYALSQAWTLKVMP